MLTTIKQDNQSKPTGTSKLDSPTTYSDDAPLFFTELSSKRLPSAEANQENVPGETRTQSPIDTIETHVNMSESPPAGEQEILLNGCALKKSASIQLEAYIKWVIETRIILPNSPPANLQKLRVAAYIAGMLSMVTGLQLGYEFGKLINEELTGTKTSEHILGYLFAIIGGFPMPILTGNIMQRAAIDFWVSQKHPFPIECKNKQLKSCEPTEFILNIEAFLSATPYIYLVLHYMTSIPMKIRYPLAINALFCCFFLNKWAIKEFFTLSKQQLTSLLRTLGCIKKEEDVIFNTPLEQLENNFEKKQKAIANLSSIIADDKLQLLRNIMIPSEDPTNRNTPNIEILNLGIKSFFKIDSEEISLNTRQNKTNATKAIENLFALSGGIIGAAANYVFFEIGEQTADAALSSLSINLNNPAAIIFKYILGISASIFATSLGGYTGFDVFKQFFNYLITPKNLDNTYNNNFKTIVFLTFIAAFSATPQTYMTYNTLNSIFLTLITFIGVFATNLWAILDAYSESKNSSRSRFFAINNSIKNNDLSQLDSDLVSILNQQSRIS